ncbi:MAG: hypothetical protein FWC54_06615 [Actinomycetia bacterium]|nr:hypothetical protein [Actinomycetes bacterium]
MELIRKGRRAKMPRSTQRVSAFLWEAERRIYRAIAKLRIQLHAGLRDESGQGVAEYVIILAVIVVAAIILAVAFHDKLAAVWQSVTDQLGDLA